MGEREAILAEFKRVMVYPEHHIQKETWSKTFTIHKASEVETTVGVYFRSQLEHIASKNMIPEGTALIRGETDDEYEIRIHASGYNIK